MGLAGVEGIFLRPCWSCCLSSRCSGRCATGASSRQQLSCGDARHVQLLDTLPEVNHRRKPLRRPLTRSFRSSTSPSAIRGAPPAVRLLVRAAARPDARASGRAPAVTLSTASALRRSPARVESCSEVHLREFSLAFCAGKCPSAQDTSFSMAPVADTSSARAGGDPCRARRLLFERECARIHRALPARRQLIGERGIRLSAVSASVCHCSRCSDAPSWSSTGAVDLARKTKQPFSKHSSAAARRTTLVIRAPTVDGGERSDRICPEHGDWSKPVQPSELMAARRRVSPADGRSNRVGY